MRPRASRLGHPGADLDVIGVGGTWYWNRYPGCRCDFMPYVGGVHTYYRTCNEIVAKGFEGFTMSRHEAPEVRLLEAGDD